MMVDALFIKETPMDYLSFFASIVVSCAMAGHGTASRDSASTASYEQGMHRMHQAMNITYTGQVDSDFVRGMVPHHQGAVDMAHTVLEYGNDANIASLARWIISSQETEIGYMGRWIERRAAEKPVANGYDTKAVDDFKAGMETMHSKMMIGYSGDADKDFVCGMIPHHQGAIDMAKVELRSGRDPEMLALARGIIQSQSSDIARMHRWLKGKGYSCN
jgi:uncharacterized protein (DUF305 family)